MPKRPPDWVWVVVVAPPKRPPLCCGCDVEAPPPPNKPVPAGLLAAPPKSPPDAGAWEVVVVEACPKSPPDAGAWEVACPKSPPPAGGCDVLAPLEYSRGGGSSDFLYIRDDMFARRGQSREYQASRSRHPTPELRKQTRWESKTYSEFAAPVFIERPPGPLADLASAMSDPGWLLGRGLECQRGGWLQELPAFGVGKISDRVC